ncbi:MAG: nitroreductase [Burkholderiaceae bacterium]|jgi:nitroreductase|nr:nitroreductase [Burkholderiaceae bacterium]
MSRDCATTVAAAVASRKSVRRFLGKPVDPVLIRRIVEAAAQAPSGGNIQPWHVHVLGGDALRRFRALMRERVLAQPEGEPGDFSPYPPGLVSPYRERRDQVGEALYASLGIPRSDKPRRMRQFVQNFQFFDAPVGMLCSIDRNMGAPQWVDCGIFLQTLALLLREAGLHGCMQTCWIRYPRTIEEFLALPAGRTVLAGMAIGYEDPSAPINQWRTPRAPLEAFAAFVGI